MHPSKGFGHYYFNNLTWVTAHRIHDLNFRDRSNEVSLEMRRPPRQPDWNGRCLMPERRRKVVVFTKRMSLYGRPETDDERLWSTNGLSLQRHANGRCEGISQDD
jgi:hypothetical protein